MAGPLLVAKLEELAALDSQTHWFCPRSRGDDDGVFFDEDWQALGITETTAEKAARHAKIEEARTRQSEAQEICTILAFDGADARTYQEKLKRCLHKQLTRCDICVREFHRARRRLRTTLEAEFPPDEVLAFMLTFDEMNDNRIIAGLNNMTETLMDLPPDERKITAAGDVGMYAMFEALHCIPFLRNEDHLQKHFDKPFRLVQTKKKVNLPNFAPGMAAFLFGSNTERYAWAERNVSKIKRDLYAEEFDSAVRPFLEAALARVHVINLDLEFLPVFWRAARLFISKLNKRLVQDNLQALEVNFFTTSLEHFQIDAPHFPDLLASYDALLRLSGPNFWNAFGSASPQNLVEAIFKAPRLQKMLTVTDEKEPLRLEDKMAWIDPFIRSMKPANLVPPLRTLLDQLLHTFQSEKYSRYATSVTWEKGLTCLLDSIRIIANAVDGGPVYIHLVECVAKDHISEILGELQGIEKKEELAISKTELLDLDILENILAMDVKGLDRDRRYIEKTSELDHELGATSMALWKLSLRAIKSGKPALPMSILHGIKNLVKLDKLPPNIMKRAPKQATAWNNALTRVHNHVITDLLGRLDALSPEQAAELFQEHKAAQGLMALLFSANEQIHQNALQIFKNMSAEDNRRNSLMWISEVFFSTSLGAVSETLKLITEARIFGPCPILLKLCTDMLSCLCDSQDGLLRTRGIKNDADVEALRRFWHRCWTTVEMIFEMTETWSGTGLDKGMMQEFCRETMDFADYAFDQYAIFAGTLEAGGASSDVGKQLLNLPNKAFKCITKWLRLRDDYLITKAVGLTSKILVRLQEVGIRIPAESEQYVEDIVTSSPNDKNVKIKTKLTMQHKAELQRALERHTGESLVSETIEVSRGKAKTKQLQLGGWAMSGDRADSRSVTPTSAAPSTKSKNIIDLDSWSKTAEDKKSQPKKPMLAAEQRRQQQNKAAADTAAFLQKRKKAQAEQQQLRDAQLAKLNAQGAGSGVLGLGNLAAEHGAKQNIMVDSDEEDESDDDDVDNDLFGGTAKPKKQERQNFDFSKTSGLKPEVKKGPTKINRQARSLKDMRARLAPDLGNLHRLILAWDIFHQGEYPPGQNPDLFSAVANSFRDPVTYQQTFEPLLILEAWQGLIKEREENSNKSYEIKVQNRSNVDQFIEISSLVGHQENRDLQLSEGDIILLSKSSKPLSEPGVPHCLARVYRLKRQKAHIEVLYQVLPGSALANQLTMQTIVHGLKIQSITPLEREYGALRGLQYFDLCNQITRAKPSPMIQFSERQVHTSQDNWNLNKAQAEAVNGALENEGFSLIQGPPGSGKTKTIVAIVGGLLSQALNNTVKGATRISMPKANGNGIGIGDAPSKKLLVCAPSNAAVDELVMRLKAGIKTKSGQSHEINVVRLGRSDAINQQVRDVTMDELVRKKLGGNDGDEKQRQRNAELFKEHESISAKLRELYQQRDNVEAGQKMEEKDRKVLEDTIVHVRRRKGELGTRIDQVKDQERNAGREQEMNRKRAQQAVLDQAHVICATLSGSGHDMFQALSIEFETVIIDEAAQCVEMSSLIPLKYGCIKCIMVGDPKQLPPTVFSKQAAAFQYEQSLFVRMQNNYPNEVHLLDTQYRMHPHISLFPSRTFYDGLLKDGDGMAGLRTQPWHKSALLAPYRFFDVSGQHQSAPKGHSLVNYAEISIAELLYDRLRADFPDYDFTGRIGIITPYKSQLRELKNRFAKKYGEQVFDFIEFNTTDAFQGRESEVIIFSCVRASPAGGIGFLQDIRRMNVGLTRAKSSLWVLGNGESLSRGEYWKKLVDDAKDRDCYTTGRVEQMLKKPSSHYPAANGETTSMSDVRQHASQMNPSGHGSTGSKGITRTEEVKIAAATAQTPSVDQAPPQSASAAHRAASDEDEDRMDGIRYRFQDRIGKSKKSERPVVAQDGGDDDVDMTDVALDAPLDAQPAVKGRVESPVVADGTGRSVSNAPSTGSRGGTPGSLVSSAADGINGGAKSGASDAGGSRSALAQSAVPPKMVKKRPAAASPFMPKRKPGAR